MNTACSENPQNLRSGSGGVVHCHTKHRSGARDAAAFVSRGAGAGDDPALLPAASFQSHGGAIASIGPHDTAFSHRDVFVEFVAAAKWTDPAEDEVRMATGRRFGSAMEPFSTGAYVNTLGDEGEAGIRRAYRDSTLARLAELKTRYDPANVFQLNQNVRPIPDPGRGHGRSFT